MQSRIYHGDIEPNDIARALVAYFHRGNFRVQQIGKNEKLNVQIATHQMATSGGQTASGIAIEKVEDGISIQVGQQAWIGVAASLGKTAITLMTALKNPFRLLERLDDLAQDIESLRLSEEIWRVIEEAVRRAGASLELSERMRRIVCEYCNTANPIGEPRCIACGAPLGSVQPDTCDYCGFVVNKGEINCPYCGKPLQ